MATANKKKVSSKSVSKLQPKKVVKRKFTRFVPELPTTALIVSGTEGSRWKDPLPCLVLEESYGGCRLVALKNKLLTKGAALVFKVGNLSEMPGQIKWIKIHADEFCSFGVEYSAK